MDGGKVRICVSSVVEPDACDDERTAGSRCVVGEPVRDDFAFCVGCEAVLDVDGSTFGAGVGAHGRVKADGKAGFARGLGTNGCKGVDGVTLVEDVGGDDVKIGDGVAAEGVTFGGVLIGVYEFSVGVDGADGGVDADGGVGAEGGAGKEVRMVGSALTVASVQKEGLPLVPTLQVDTWY